MTTTNEDDATKTPSLEELSLKNKNIRYHFYSQLAFCIIILCASIEPLANSSKYEYTLKSRLSRHSLSYPDFNTDDSLHGLYPRKGGRGNGGGSGGGRRGGSGSIEFTWRLICSLSLTVSTVYIFYVLLWLYLHKVKKIDFLSIRGIGWNWFFLFWFVFIAVLNRVWAAVGEPKKKRVTLNAAAMQPAFIAQFVGDALMILSLTAFIIFCYRMRKRYNKKWKMTPMDLEKSIDTEETQTVTTENPATSESQPFLNQHTVRVSVAEAQPAPETNLTRLQTSEKTNV
ncbi:hypothetical protein BDZ91DRAFT_848863 [Kalaharituber pfeilii]|nr:hypothetical protein BDZ91DRAFT_848863 [Kalaharituber pfeilii]